MAGEIVDGTAHVAARQGKLPGSDMGGMLSFIIAANRPDKVRAVVPFYEFPQGESEPDWSTLDASVSGHMAEHDDFFRPPRHERSKPSLGEWART